MNGYHYVDTIISHKRFDFKFKDLFKANLKLYENANNFCNKGSNTEKLKFYCPLADALKKYENAFEEDDFVFFKKKYGEDGIEKKLDLSKIINSKIINQSNDYYSSQKTKIHEAPEQRGKTLKIIGIYYTEDKQTAVIAYENSFTDVKGEISFHILKKQKNIWWKSLGTLQRL